MYLAKTVRRLALFPTACVLLGLVVACSDRSSPSEDRVHVMEVIFDRDELREISDAAMVSLGFVFVDDHSDRGWTEPDLPSCFGFQGAGRCAMPREPETNLIYSDSTNPDILAQVVLIQPLSSEPQLGDRDLTTGSLRSLMSGDSAPTAAKIADEGPCNPRADRRADDGCAWRERQSPDLGDKSRAWTMDVFTEWTESRVSFIRGPLTVTVVVHFYGAAPTDEMADEIAAALDEQIKAALPWR